MLKRSSLFGFKTRVTFSIPGTDPHGTVSVVGDFNDWEPGRHELLPRRNGTRSVSVILSQGVHRFRYLGPDGLWFDDDSADLVDGEGCLIKL
jgi:hypothetical protein